MREDIKIATLVLCSLFLLQSTSYAYHPYVRDAYARNACANKCYEDLDQCITTANTQADQKSCVQEKDRCLSANCRRDRHSEIYARDACKNNCFEIFDQCKSTAYTPARHAKCVNKKKQCVNNCRGRKRQLEMINDEDLDDSRDINSRYRLLGK